MDEELSKSVELNADKSLDIDPKFQSGTDNRSSIIDSIELTSLSDAEHTIAVKNIHF